MDLVFVALFQRRKGEFLKHTRRFFVEGGAIQLLAQRFTYYWLQKLDKKDLHFHYDVVGFAIFQACRLSHGQGRGTSSRT